MNTDDILAAISDFPDPETGRAISKTEQITQDFDFETQHTTQNFQTLLFCLLFLNLSQILCPAQLLFLA